MCGIAGILSLNGRPVETDELRSMCAAIAHRGPDDEGFYLDAGIGLGMRRLSIIDLHYGAQPLANEDGSIWIVFNGEIYNFHALRHDLEKRGHRFRTATDTEAIVHLYEEHGEQCVTKLRGMFGFALWDTRRKRLLLARDRLGIKPLYWAEMGGRLLFGSELKSILQIPEVERDLNWESVSHVFSALSTPARESIIKGVHKLEPGCTLTASPGAPISARRYWELKFEPNQEASEEQLSDRLRDLLDESVRIHMISDVPLGAFLSGGVDSSSVVAMASRMNSGPLKTFSIGFGDANYDELRYARQVAERFGTDHRELVVEPNILESLDDLAWYLDEPFGDSSAIPTYMVSKLAAEHVTVILSGDGGDELFAGYDKYVVESRERRLDAIPGAARKLLAMASRVVPEGVRGHNSLHHFSLAWPDRYMDASTLFRLEQKRRLFTPEVFARLAAYDPCSDQLKRLGSFNGDWLSAAQNADVHAYLPLDILTKVDRMSMAHSLETRVPLLDHELVEFAATIPPRWKLRDGATKHVFKRAMRGILPDEILNRPKQGFAAPLASWFRGRLGPYVRELLLSGRARQRGIFDTRYIGRLIGRLERGRQLDLQLWTLISFELWCRTFLDGRRGPRANDRIEGYALRTH